MPTPNYPGRPPGQTEFDTRRGDPAWQYPAPLPPGAGPEDLQYEIDDYELFGDEGLVPGDWWRDLLGIEPGHDFWEPQNPGGPQNPVDYDAPWNVGAYPSWPGYNTGPVERLDPLAPLPGIGFGTGFPDPQPNPYPTGGPPGMHGTPGGPAPWTPNQDVFPDWPEPQWRPGFNPPPFPRINMPPGFMQPPPAPPLDAPGASMTPSLVPGGIPAFAQGGDFITNGPQTIMVGEGGPERVQVQPLSGQNSMFGPPPHLPVNTPVEEGDIPYTQWPAYQPIPEAPLSPGASGPSMPGPGNPAYGGPQIGAAPLDYSMDPAVSNYAQDQSFMGNQIPMMDELDPSPQVGGGKGPINPIKMRLMNLIRRRRQMPPRPPQRRAIPPPLPF